jgi:5-formaminoimidazole-4-carboxamide-1-beta-D-ribofuranosyl 5'-monophosphate synthetase
MTAWSAGELAISIKEPKIAEGFRAGNQFFATRDAQCTPEILGPFGMELKWCSAHRMA